MLMNRTILDKRCLMARYDMRKDGRKSASHDFGDGLIRKIKETNRPEVIEGGCVGALGNQGYEKGCECF